ncbi:MAG: oligosaccharide flippase family protein [Motilibacteraceae bacterium]
MSGDPSLRRSAVSGVAWSILQRWGIRVASLGTFTFLAHRLTAVDFGTAALASSIIGIIAILAEGGFGTYVLQHPSTIPRTVSTCFWVAICLSLVFTALTASGGAAIALLDPSSPIGLVIIALSPTLVLTALSSIQSALLRRALKFKSLAIRSLVSTVVSSCLAVALAAAGAGVWALVAQTVCQSLVGVATLWWASTWRPSLEFDRAAVPKIFKFSVSVLGVNLISAFNRGDELLLGLIAGTEALGVYSIAKRLLNLVLELVSTTLGAVGVPLLVRVKEDRVRLASAFTTMFKVMNLCSTLATFTLAALSPVLIPLVFGAEWAKAWPAATMLAIGGAATAASYFDRGVLYALGRERTELRLTATMTLGVLLASVLSAPFGTNALALALGVRAYLMWPIRMRAIGKAIGLPVRMLVVGAVRLWAVGLLFVGVALVAANSGMSRGILILCEGSAVVALTLALAALEPKTIISVVEAVPSSGLQRVTLRLLSRRGAVKGTAGKVALGSD